MKALLIVDLQNDFLPGGALAVPAADEIISVINDWMANFECVVATKDWHPKNHISFASTHGLSVGTEINIQGRKQKLWPDHCLQNSQGADFPPSFNRQQVQEVIFKGTDPFIDSYSAFFDNAHKRATGLEEYLKKRGIKHIDVVGVATDYCVKYSVLDALQLGFTVTVLLKGCRGIDLTPGDCMRALQEMHQAGAHLKE